MKRIIYALSIIFLPAISLFAQNETLRGDEAIAKLKQTGQYDSLLEAVRDARKENGQTDEAQTADAVGQTAQVTASDGAANDRFGISVAISGDTAIVGASSDDVGANANQGSAYIFVRNGTTWTEQAKLTALDGAAQDFFGVSVSIYGDTAVVGANMDDVGANMNRGSAYVFIRNGTTWTQQAQLIASDGAGGDQFGFSVSISGETVIAGAYLDDVGANSNQGSAYVFVRSGTAWTEQAKLTAADGAVGDGFGYGVSISGNTIIAGASGDDIGANSDQGSAYIFVRNGTTWTEQAKLTASDGAASDQFGISAAVSGETAIVGAIYDDVGANSDQGSAYIFVRNGTTWTEQAKLTASDGAADDQFGYGVSIYGGTVSVGAPGSNVDKGSAYVFVRKGMVWMQQPKLTALDGAANDGFGFVTAVSGDKIIVGALSDDVGANTDQGSAYFFVADVAAVPVRSPFDFDGDGKTDISIFRPSVGEWWINRSSTSQVVAGAFGNSTDKIVPADFTGDGKSDIAVWRGSTGEWFILRSENASYYSVPFGQADDVPAPADFDGDGKADSTVFRPSNGTWFINKSSGGTDIVTFGQAGDVPVVGDYDGDGKADIAIFRPSNGQWWLSRSTAGIVAATFGVSSDKPVQGDFSGDGKTDLAFWRPASGEWFILRSENSSFYSVPFGQTGDIPTPGDYDGDGKTDTAVFRSGVWYVQQSTSGILIRQFGLGDDKPVPSAFVP